MSDETTADDTADSPPEPSPTAPAEKASPFVKPAAILFASILALIALAVPLSLFTTTAPNTDGYAGELSSTLSWAEVNNDSAKGAPQQQVVNGWTARDLAALQIRQNNELIRQNHVQIVLAATLLAIIGTLALCAAVFAVTTLIRNWLNSATKPDPAAAIPDDHDFPGESTLIYSFV